MNLLRLTIRPLSDFGTPLAGDTLFGQLCWAVRERWGEKRLSELLAGYCEGRPYAVLSDGFPEGFLPRPMLPDMVIGRGMDPARRKITRQQAWLPLTDVALPLVQWLERAVACSYKKEELLTQNTINRVTGTTGTGLFAPRRVARISFAPETRLDVHVVLDETRLDRDEFRQLMQDMGNTGFGRDATTGLGKYVVESVHVQSWQRPFSRHFMTLAPCAPVPAAVDASSSYYQPMTRFGRHGNLAVLGGAPFKRPILMMRTAAFLTMRSASELPFHGTGIGGEMSPISTAIRQTVQQGYAPLAPLNFASER